MASDSAVRCAHAPVDAHVNEALLLAETEELLNCLEPTAFTLDLVHASAPSHHQHHYAPKNASHDAAPATPNGHTHIKAPTSSPSPLTAKASGGKPRGRRSWKPNAMRNPSRERLQNELATLRRQASELEAELTLARRHEHALEQNRHLVVPSWERIAKRQLTRRGKSEDENKRLRALIESQKVFVAQLQHAWYRWQRLARFDPYSGIAPTTVRFSENDPAIFEMLTANLDLEYLRMGQVFANAGLLQHKYTASSKQVATTRLLPNGEAVPILELSSVEIDPYDFELLTEASWQVIQRVGTARNRILFTDLAAPEITSAVKMRIPSVQDGKPVFLEELCATKRYVERDRVTYVWRSVTREEDTHGAFPDTFIEETGWLMLKDMADAGGGTVTLTCLQLEPKRVRGLTPLAGEAAARDPFADLVLHNFESDLVDINHMIEDLVLDASERKREAAAPTHQERWV